MIRTRHLLMIATLLALTACSGGHRVTYSGHEESTVGVPGFDAKGKRMSPNVKLGQSYSVDGETYIPHHQPDYAEEGLASWYGPGFHGGKTANGEIFDKHEMTAAHRTLPLPSIVRVTLASTGKSAIVRVNDRGPFSKGRIIDLSRGAAEKIGLVGVGVGKVKVEYLPAESQRFADLMADGRDPKSIDVNEEVLAYVNNQRDNAPAQTIAADPFALAQNEAPPASPPAPVDGNWWDRLMPVSDAQASDNNSTPAISAPAAPVITPRPMGVTLNGDNPDSVSSSELPAIAAPVSNTVPTILPAQPRAVATNPSTAPPRRVLPVSTPPPASASPASPPAYLQLGAFANKANAEALVAKVGDLGPASVNSGVIANGQTIYRVRMGPYTTPKVLDITVSRLGERGIEAQPVRDSP